MAATVVNVDNFVRAETDRKLAAIARQAGGVNRWFHYREPTPLHRQTVIRMNRDTLYSAVVADISKNATITLPEELWDWETRDLFGGSGFPDIAPDGTITITLGSRDFFWLALAPRRGEVRG